MPLSLGALFGGLADALAPTAAAAEVGADVGAATLPTIVVTPSAIGGAEVGAEAGAGLLGGVDAGTAAAAAAAGGLGGAFGAAPFIGPTAGLGGGFGGFGGGGAGFGGPRAVGAFPGGSPGYNPLEAYELAHPEFAAGAGGAAGGLAPVAGASPLGAGFAPVALPPPPPPPPAPSTAPGVGGLLSGTGTGGASAIAGPPGVGANALVSQDLADLAAVPPVPAAGASPLPVLSEEGLGLGQAPSVGGAFNPGESTIAAYTSGAPAPAAGEQAIADTLIGSTPTGSFGTAGSLDNLAATGNLAGTLPPSAPTALGSTTTRAAAASSNPLSNLFSGGNMGTTLEAGGLGLGALALLMGLTKSQQKLPYQPQQENIANQAGANAANLSAEGQQFLQPSLTGQLPPQLEAQVQLALQDSINTTKARYASLGLGNSTMVSDQISYLQLQAEAMRGTLATQLAQTGTQLLSQSTQDLSLEGNIYSGLMQAQIAQDNALEQSVAQFAGSLALAGAISSTGVRKAA